MEPLRQTPIHLTNRLGELARARGLNEAEIGQRVGQILGREIDPRTLRRYLDGAPIADSTMTTVATIARAIGVGLGEAVTLEPEESLEQVLGRAGRTLVRLPDPGREPAGFGTPDPSWGFIVEPFLAERHREI